jgi:2-aminoethylphosphonate-pyruvate transaminase
LRFDCDSLLQEKVNEAKMSIYNFHNPTFRGPDGQEDMPWLLTPGPLTTSRTVKLAALADWGSRDAEFQALVKDIRDKLKQLGGCDETHECVLMQGPGTFGIEALLGALCPTKRKKTLVIANGVYGARAADIVERLGRPLVRMDKGDTRTPSAAEIGAALDGDKAISHVWVVHCETTSGLINPLEEIAHEVKTRGRVLMVDAMSSFGALPIDMTRAGIDALVSAPNKCLEGLPGFSFILMQKELLEESQGQSHSLSLDLFEQWRAMEAKGQFRFTPPTHTLVAFRQALRELEEEGGSTARLSRYTRNAEILLHGLTSLGFVPLQTTGGKSPIIQTFLQPRDPNFTFEAFHKGLRQRGFSIYPGALTRQPSFRIGTIGKLEDGVMQQVVTAVAETLKDMNVKDLGPEKS